MDAHTAPEIDGETLNQLMDVGSAPTLLDIREDWEIEICSLPGSLHIPMNDLPGNLGRIPADENLVVICHHGHRSLQVVGWLQANGFTGAVSLMGGLHAWAQRIDPSMPMY